MLQVTAGILVDRGSILACQRLAGADHAGKWEFPGGKREAEETLQGCLRRELEEELGIDARIGSEVWRATHRYPGRTELELVFYAVAETHGTIRNRVFAALRWVPVGSLFELDFLAADRAVVEALDRGDLVVPATIGVTTDKTDNTR
jgi:8-oxo-dGTP diphosphatase